MTSPTDTITLDKIGAALAARGLSMSARRREGVHVVTLASEARVVHGEGRTLSQAFRAAWDAATKA